MNSVHEPGSNGDSKTSPSRKPGRKTKPGARAPSWPSWHAQVRTGTPSRPPCAPLAPARPLRSTRASHKSARCRAPRAAAPRLPHALPAQRPTLVPLAPAASPCRTPAPRARPRACCHAQPSAQRAHARACCAQRRVVACAATQSSSPLFQLSQYNFLYCDTNSLQPSPLQYNSAMQLSPLHCNTRNCIAI